jgi:hypothetical protein
MRGGTRPKRRGIFDVASSADGRLIKRLQSLIRKFRVTSFCRGIENYSIVDYDSRVNAAPRARHLSLHLPLVTKVALLHPFPAVAR